MIRWYPVKRNVSFMVTFFILAVLFHTANLQGKIMDYEVVSVGSTNWVVTARETATGNVFRFKLRPSVLIGKTFDVDLRNSKPGQKMTVRCSQNTRLDRLIIEKPLPGEAIRPVQRRRGSGRLRRSMRLDWKITNVTIKWIVTARNHRNGKVASFQAHPEAFTGFRFKASVRGIPKGKTFSITVPNARSIKNAFTLLRIK